jgi:poly(hydroxyalkanoate) granule-associated protein
MVKKMDRSGGGTADAKSAKGSARFAGSVKDSASQIWLAGLGAFAKAQEEGGKVFEALVKEGQSLQRKTQSAAEEKLSEATARMASMAGDISSRASGQWDKLEGIFEERVSRALNKLGVPSAKDVEALIARIDALDRSVERLRAAQGMASKPAKATKSTRASSGTTGPAASKRSARKTTT